MLTEILYFSASLANLRSWTTMATRRKPAAPLQLKKKVPTLVSILVILLLGVVFAWNRPQNSNECGWVKNKLLIDNYVFCVDQGGTPGPGGVIVKKEVKKEPVAHRDPHRTKDIKPAESELVRDMKAQLK